MKVPAAYGGAEAGPVALALALAEIARGDASVGVAMSVTNMVAETIARFGTEAARQRYLPRLCSGEAVAGAFALSEPQAGSDPGAMATTAERADAGGRLPPARLQAVDHLGRSRRRDADGRAQRPRRWAAPDFRPSWSRQGTPGLTAGRHEDKMGLRGSTTVALTIDDVVVPADALLGGEGDGLKVALSALGGGRIGIAAQALGIARAAFEAARAYARPAPPVRPARSATSRPCGSCWPTPPPRSTPPGC